MNKIVYNMILIVYQASATVRGCGNWTQRWYEPTWYERCWQHVAGFHRTAYNVRYLLYPVKENQGWLEVEVH